MKFKKNRSHVVVEIDRNEAGLPPGAVPELRIKQILVPVDFSACSRKAFQYGVSLARQFGAEVILLHVVVVVPPPPQMLIFEIETSHSEYCEEAAKHLSEWRKGAGAQAPVKAVVREGVAAHQEIVAAARECNSDLIVIGNQGRSGWSRVLTGSTAERVVRHAPCPVLIVRGQEHEFLVAATEKTHEKSGAV